MPRTSLFQSSGGILCLSYSSTGSLVSGGADRCVRLIDVQQGLVRVLHGHTAAVCAVAHTRAGGLLSGGEDGSLRLWAAPWMSPDCGVLRAHYGAVRAVDADAQGLVLSAGDDRLVKLWGARSRRLVRSLSGHSAAVLSACFSPEGGRLASAGRDESILLWDVEAGAWCVVAHGVQRGAAAQACVGRQRTACSVGRLRRRAYSSPPRHPSLFPSPHLQASRMQPCVTGRAQAQPPACASAPTAARWPPAARMAA